MFFDLVNKRTTAASAAALLIAGCGGGTGSFTATTDLQNNFKAAYSNGVAALNTTTGLQNAAFVDLFDAAYLDTGSSKTATKAALDSEAAVSSGTTDSFVQVSVADMLFSNCDGLTNTCAVTVTLNNADADTTSATFVTVIKLTEKARLFGNQSNS